MGGRLTLHRGVQDAKTLKVMEWYGLLERIHVGYDLAARAVQAVTGVPICTPNCGFRCCDVSVMAWGIEAEYARSVLLGEPSLQKPVLDACREWLTRPGKYSYGGGLTAEKWRDLERAGEVDAVSRETCCFVTSANRCLIHRARPAVCRAYGVVHVPSPHCRRPIGLNESSDARAHWDENCPTIPLKRMWQSLVSQLDDPRFSRQGWFPLMVFEALATQELAGLIDDGKVPLVKSAVVWGGGYAMLWQEQINAMWSAEAADRSIADQPPIEDRDGKPVMVFDVV